MWAQTAGVDDQSAANARVAIVRDQSVSSLPSCLVLHKSGLFSKGQCNGVWILTVNLDEKVLTYAAFYNADLMGEQVTTNFTLGQAIFRHSFGEGMNKPVLKRFASDEEQGLVDVANGISYDIGRDFGDSMPDASVPVRTVKYLQSAEALIILLKETKPEESSFPALTAEQLEALKASLMKQPEAPAGPKLK